MTDLITETTPQPTSPNLLARIAQSLNPFRKTKTTIPLDVAVKDYGEVGTGLFLKLEMPGSASQYSKYFREFDFDLRSPSGRAIYDGLVAGKEARFVGDLEIEGGRIIKIGLLTGTLSVGNDNYKIRYVIPPTFPVHGSVKPEPKRT